MTCLGQMASDVVIHPGSRILGEKTSIGPGCEIGAEAPVTLKNCQLGRNVELKGGYFEGAVFLDGSNMGSGAHVRAGTVVEEEAGGAHAVGLKQTVLLPFVTLGSLINFCDVLMAGGTSRRDHSEVGSSYIHFNFTPYQDKATASLVGDVPAGVLLAEKPIFLGGQGGLVGPTRIAYGSVIAAGGICRRDILDQNQLHVPAVPAERTVPFDADGARHIERLVHNNLLYIGNIKALRVWYEHVRVLFVRDDFDQAVLDGALRNFNIILAERIKRLEQLAEKNKELSEVCADMREQLEAPLDTVASAGLMGEVEAADHSDYIGAIKNIGPGARAGAMAWLQGIVDETSAIGS